MNTWIVLHRYNRLADTEVVPSLTCPDCESVFFWLIGEDDEPVAWCAGEDKKFYPGLQFWKKVEQMTLENAE